jgi:hypothetical protein
MMTPEDQKSVDAMNDALPVWRAETTQAMCEYAVEHGFYGKDVADAYIKGKNKK